MALYHRDVHWPKRIQNKLPFGVRTLSYSQHAVKASQDDRYGIIQLPHKVNLDTVSVVEAEELDKNSPISKIVFRFPLDEGRDLVVAAIPERTGLFVKTVWINVANDSHKTLRKNEYLGA